MESPSVITSGRQYAFVRVYTLGQLRLERRRGGDGTTWQTVTDSSWQHQHVRALLSCLISTPGRKLPREELMEAIFPDLESETAGGRLDRAVYSLRHLFEPARTRPATSPLLLTQHETLVLADQPQVWVDADEFEQCLHLSSESDDPGEREDLLERAVLLYGGDFLAGEAHESGWLLSRQDARRDSLQRSWATVALTLADVWIARDALPAAIRLLERVLAADPTNEAAAERLICLFAQLGRAGEALRVYKRLADALRAHYHVAPLARTRELYEALKRA